MSHTTSDEEELSYSHLFIASQKWAWFKEPQIARMICNDTFVKEVQVEWLPR